MILIAGSRLSTAKRSTTEYRENTITIINKIKTDRTIEVEILMFPSILYSQKKYWMRHKGNGQEKSYHSKLSSILKEKLCSSICWDLGMGKSPFTTSMAGKQDSRSNPSSTIKNFHELCYIWQHSHVVMVSITSSHFSQKLNTNNFFFF